MMRSPVALALSALLALTACGDAETGDTSAAPVFVGPGVSVVGGWPGVRGDDGVWVRQCGEGPVDGVLVDFELVANRSSNFDDSDRDYGLAPGDQLSSGALEGDGPTLTTAGDVALELGCWAAADVDAPADCVAAAVTVDDVGYVGAERSRDGHDVLLLVDQSGSISGLINHEQGDREDRVGDFAVPPNFGALASDGSNIRLSVARRFIEDLNSEDRVGVVAFSEKLGLAVPCAVATGNDPEAATSDLDACFGADPEVWTSTEGLDSLIGRAEGRSNLWEAVAFASDYLSARAEAGRTQHVVVLADGPDTCTGEGLAQCDLACSDVGFEDAMARVDAGAPTLHFVQFEALGYGDRDPRQLAAACASGGSYHYLNSNDFPALQPTQLRQAMEVALMHVRYALKGHWQLAAAAPEYTDDAALPAGALYAADGALTVTAQSGLYDESALRFPFGVGLGGGAEGASTWDRRLTLRKPCASDAACGAQICSPEAQVCAEPYSCEPVE